MERRRLERYAPLAGLLFLVLAVVAFVLSSDPPDTDESTAQVVEYWQDNEAKEIVSAILTTLAGAALVWFAASLRAAISRVEGGSGRLGTLALSGAVIIATGLGVVSAFAFAAADTVGDVPPQVTQTLAVLYADTFFPMVVGALVLYVSAGMAILRYRVLPVWLGVVALIGAVVAVSPLGFFAFLLLLVWVAVVGVLMFRSGAGTDTESPLPPPGAPTPASHAP